MNFTGHIPYQDAKIYCQKLGHDSHKPTTLIFHGGPGIGFEHSAKTSSQFTEISNLIYFDPLGTGNSSTARGPDDYNLAGYAKQGKAILDYFHIHEAVIMGSSWGSMVALHFALHYPQAVSKLILIAGAPSYHFLTEAESALIQYGNSEQQHIAQKLLAGEMTTQTEMQQYFQIMGPLYSTQFKPHYRWPVMDYNLTIINAALRSRYYQFDYRDLLPNIKQPTLIIFGEHDRITPISQAKIMAAGIPHSQLVIVANAGHTIGSDAPETYRQAITQFIKG